MDVSTFLQPWALDACMPLTTDLYRACLSAERSSEPGKKRVRHRGLRAVLASAGECVDASMAKVVALFPFLTLLRLSDLLGCSRRPRFEKFMGKCRSCCDQSVD
jgi:hypothetical protein